MAGLRLGVIERGVEVGPLQVRVDQGEHPGHVALAARLVGRTDQGLVFLGHEPQYRAPDAWPVQRLISASSWRRAGPGANITSSWSSGWPVARSTRTGSISAPVWRSIRIIDRSGGASWRLLAVAGREQRQHDRVEVLAS